MRHLFAHSWQLRPRTPLNWVQPIQVCSATYSLQISSITVAWWWSAECGNLVCPCRRLFAAMMTCLPFLRAVDPLDLFHRSGLSQACENHGSGPSSWKHRIRIQTLYKILILNYVWIYSVCLYILSKQHNDVRKMIRNL